MSSFPKIAQVVCTYPPYRGGMGRVAFEYTERLRARGYNVHVFTSQLTTSSGVGDIDPDYVHRVPSVLSIGNASVMPSLFQRLKGFDLVHLHYPFFGGAEPVVVRKAIRHDQGLVMTYHMDAEADGVRGAIFEAHKRLLFPWIANRADRILVSSKDYADSSVLKNMKGVHDRMEIHPFGVDLQRFFPGDETEFARAHGIPTNVPVLLFVGGLDSAHHFKGLMVLFDALQNLIDHPWHLVIVGDGNLRQMYEQRAADLGLGTRSTFVGGVTDEELPFYYRVASIHLFPSTRRAEAFGLVALEAAASGIPTIASNLPGVRSVVLDGETGLLVPPEDVKALQDAIRFLLERTDVRENFGRSARGHAESKFAWEPLIAQLEQTYKSVINQQSQREY